ncbi:hypothetical protein ACEN2J_12860 [Pseudorhodobacter sp. W20_MBD10_FR17]|uniref:hypothetical protein n=1 Tax=Pseudorhodobacter sp. W20_MBD10_FR17 TaxID=3240266 RepID=UPI003F94B694
MTQTQYLPFSFVDMNGTASRKRGWLVFAATLAGIIDSVSRILLPSAGTSMLDLGAWRSGRYWRAVE